MNTSLFRWLLSNLYSDLMLCRATDTDTSRIPVYPVGFFFFFSGICQHIKSYSTLLRHIHAYWGIIKAHSDLFMHIQSRNNRIFTTLSYSELIKALWNVDQAYSELCYRALFNHIQNLVHRLHMQKSGILGILEYSELFNNCMPTRIHNPVVFTKIHEYSELWHI